MIQVTGHFLYIIGSCKSNCRIFDKLFPSGVELSKDGVDNFIEVYFHNKDFLEMDYLLIKILKLRQTNRHNQSVMSEFMKSDIFLNKVKTLAQAVIEDNEPNCKYCFNDYYEKPEACQTCLNFGNYIMTDAMKKLKSI